MLTVDECMNMIEKKINSISRYHNDYNLYKSCFLHLNDYKNLLELACKNSINFDTYEMKKEFADKDKELC